MEIIVRLDGLATILTSQIEWTSTVEVISQINAGAGRWTDSWQAVVDVALAVLAGVARWADANVFGAIVNTSCAILACIIGTGIILILTTNSSVRIRAGTVQTRAKVPAEASVKTGRSDATLRSSLASLAISSRGASKQLGK